MTLIFKIIASDMWAKAQDQGVFRGAAIDLTDGYIHLSDASQAEETVRRHFAGQNDLVLVAFDPLVFGKSLKWEASRGGALFPHVYGDINPASAQWVQKLRLVNGNHEFPVGWNA